MQANAKATEGGQHVDRDAQFAYLNNEATCTPRPARRSTISSTALGKANPYRVYDVVNNAG